MEATAELLVTLQATLSPDPNTRITAELALTQLASKPQTAYNLTRIVAAEEVDVSLRQMSSLSAPSASEKSLIRPLVFSVLSSPSRKLRLAAASLVSTIAHPDWPDYWPSLTDELLQLIGEGRTKDETESGMRVLNDFVGVDLSEEQLLPIAKGLLPRLLEVLGNPNNHSPSTRARAILIFRQCVMTLYTVKDEHPEAVKSAVNELMPTWLDAFRVLLEVDIENELRNPEDWEPLAVRIAVYNTLEIILNSFPTHLRPLLPHFLSLSLSHLSKIAPVYHAYYISSTSDVTPPTNANGEDDSEIPSDLPALATSMLDFVTQVCRLKPVKKLFAEKGEGNLLGIAVDVAYNFAKMSTDDDENWLSDPNAFIADEDDEMVNYSVRTTCVDFVIALVDNYDSTTLEALWVGFQNQVACADQARQQGDHDWWKFYEAALTIVGSISSDLLEYVREQAAENLPSAFNLEQIFTSVVPIYLVASELPFLQGRSFVFASQFAQALPSELTNQYIDAAIQVLEQESAGVPVKVSAVRALNNFFRHLRTSVDSGRAVQTLSKLLPLLPQTTENTLVLVVETVDAALKVAGEALQADDCRALIKTVLATWFEKPEDPLLGSTICDVFSGFAGLPSPLILQTLLSEALPTLGQTLEKMRYDPFSTLASSAIDIIDSIFSGRKIPLGDGLFAAVAEILFVVLEKTEDRDVLQSGLNIITTVVRKDVAQLLNWRGVDGRSGLERVLSLVAHVLQPSQGSSSESGGLFVGDLVIHLIRKAGDSLGPVLPDLLTAFVNRLATATTASFSQSLILPFAYLLHSQTETVLALLEGIIVPGSASTPSRPALEVLLTSWCENVEVFQGYWNLKVSTVALQQLFLSQRPSLSQIVVKGDLLITAANANAIMTRARAKKHPDEFPAIPFHAKVIKILLHDVQNSGDDATFGKSAVDLDDAESDDGDDEWADDGAEFKTGDKDLDFLSDMLSGGNSLSKYLNDDDSNGGQDPDGDEDLEDDPIYTMDLQAHLLAFFREIYGANTNSFRQLAEQYLNGPEKEVLSQILGAGN